MEIDPKAKPSGTGCVECLASGGWWLHLRRCTACGHIGCCDNSPGRHARGHVHDSGHPIIASFEPGEDWFYDFRSDKMWAAEPLAPPLAHPVDQPRPDRGEASRKTGRRNCIRDFERGWRSLDVVRDDKGKGTALGWEDRHFRRYFGLVAPK